MIYISVEQVVEMHDILIREFGGIVGIRENGLLESSVTAPMVAVFGEELHKSIYDKATAYLFYITRNHPFIDGNKRTASAVCFAFLRINGKFPKYNVDEFLEFVVNVAIGKFEISEISSHLQSLCKI